MSDQNLWLYTSNVITSPPYNSINFEIDGKIICKFYKDETGNFTICWDDSTQFLISKENLEKHMKKIVSPDTAKAINQELEIAFKTEFCDFIVKNFNIQK